MSETRQGDSPDRRDDARAALGETRATAAEMAGTLRSEAAGAMADVKAEGAPVLEAARKRAEDFAETQQRAGADRAEGFADAVHEAADRLGGQSPVMARYVHEAATAIEGLGRTLRDSSPADLLGRVENLARRQPAAFFGAAVLAGFGLARFAKSSAEESRRKAQDHARPQAPGWAPADDAAGARPTTLAAASLGGAAAWPGGRAPRMPQHSDTQIPGQGGGNVI